tara:strand:+ start:5302 stop:5523 length:222 start_codon:yes stop_codon:yes gene_type:complete
MVAENDNQSWEYSDLDEALNNKISELNDYFDKFIIDINKINEKTNSKDELVQFIADMKTKVNLLSSEVFNEEE